MDRRDRDLIKSKKKLAFAVSLLTLFIIPFLIPLIFPTGMRNEVTLSNFIFLKCPIFKIFNVYCPTCGLGRARGCAGSTPSRMLVGGHEPTRATGKSVEHIAVITAAPQNTVSLPWSHLGTPSLQPCTCAPVGEPRTRQRQTHIHRNVMLLW